MDPYAKQELTCFFRRHLRDHGDTPQAVRWTQQGQRRRYEAFADLLGDLGGRSLLDFGCGKGDLLGFLRDRGAPGSYCGVDVSDELVALARRKFPDGEFLVLDVDEANWERRFDVVVACGVFNLRVADIAASMPATVRTLFGLCRESLHVNFLTARTPLHDVELFHIDPVDLLRFALDELSPKVVLRHGVITDDVFLSVYR